MVSYNMLFMLWKQQVLSMIEGYGLENFLDGSTSAPEKFCSSSKDEQNINPAAMFIGEGRTN